MGNSYCKKNYKKDEVNVAKITPIRLPKMKKNVAMASFYCLVGKIWKKYDIIRKKKNAWFVLFV